MPGGSTSRYAPLVVVALTLAMVAGCAPKGTVDSRSVPNERAGGTLPTIESMPNVVMLLVDTLRADALGAYGCPYDTSPELDQLAKQGVVFRHVLAQSPWTRPSIGSLLTSCYPRTIGIYKEQDEILPGAFVTLAEALQSHGYKTIGVHANPNINSFFNFQQGFDVYIGSEIWYNFMRPEPGRKRFRQSTLASSRELFDKAFELIEPKEDRPYYLQFVLMDVHEWYRGAHDLTRNEYRDMFRDAPNSTYLAPVRQTSADIQAFIDRLIAKPGWENTLFIVVADHGEGLDSHPDVYRSKWHGRLLYESQLRVPQIWWNPAWPDHGIEVNQRVRLLDLMPTLLDYLGFPAPAGVQGTSVLPLINDPGATVNLPPYFAVETALREHDKAGVYGPDWKYIEAYDKHKGMDPKELQAMGVAENGTKTNRIAEHPEVAADMARYLNEWREAHPKAAPLAPGAEMSEETVEQLKAIGYLDD